MTDLLRIYLDPDEIHKSGYPYAWFGKKTDGPAIKDYVRELADHRCQRCGHPYLKGQHGNGEWSRCDAACTHAGPVRIWDAFRHQWDEFILDSSRQHRVGTFKREAKWRILTVHHLNGIKHDCRWWNLVALCQRDHLLIQSKVVMNRPYEGVHSEWFKPYAAGFYAWKYLDLELSRGETMERIDELLALENKYKQDPLF